MRTLTHALAAATIATASSQHFATASPIEARIESVGLFKNGLAVVHRVVRLPGPGDYELADLPEPVHGTFWIESDGEIHARTTTREVQVSSALATGEALQDELAGRTVTIRLRDSDAPAISGRVVKVEKGQSPHAWNRSYFDANYYGWNSGVYPRGGYTVAPPARFLIIENESGQVYVDSSAIVSMAVQGQAAKITRRQPVLVLQAKGEKNQPLTATITYLSRGMAWAPSYRVDFANSTSLDLTQQAVIRNEMEDLSDAEILLISGFPNVEFANVVSPLSPTTSLANFFNQLSQPLAARHGLRREIVSQQAVMYNAATLNAEIDLSAIPTGDGVDLHYQSIGRHTLFEGDSLMLSVDDASTECERIVEWIVPDTRDAYGRAVQSPQHDSSYDENPDAPWDAVRFRNPLKYPMTTAPAMVIANGRFNGQRTTYWANPGEQTTVHINKSLSVRTMTSEFEQERAREARVDVIGYKWVQTKVDGELIVSNHRQEEITMVIRRRFSGELLQAAHNPVTRLLESGVYAVNPRRELIWTIALKPGEEQKIPYTYSVLTRM